MSSRSSCEALVVVALAGCGRLAFDDRGDASTAPADALDRNYVFVTSSVHPSAALALEDADAACNMRAAEARLPGTYRAYLSTSTVDAVARLAGARGWVRLDGKPVVDLPADIASGKMYYPILYDERRTALGDGIGHFMTGSNPDGTRSMSNCADYTSTAGNVITGCANATSGFSQCANTSCGVMRPLACFGIDHAKPLDIPTTTGRRAFLSDGAFSADMGIAGADAQCASAATRAGLTGNFLALLATTDASAASRFDAAGPPWVRPEGLALAPTAAAFLAGVSEVPLNVKPDGSYVNRTFVFTGAPSIGAAGTTATTCLNWTSAAGSDVATFGSGHTILPRGFADAAQGGNCTFDTLVYCLER